MLFNVDVAIAVVIITNITASKIVTVVILVIASNDHHS